MPKFNVLVTRDCTESTVVDVEAIDAAQARVLAVEEATHNSGQFDWVVDDHSTYNTPYATGCDEVPDAKA